ncbi:PQQ-dependent sugar dehydrogenase [Antrihabitans cavernicola]|uniref:PQQ-dependent sugar dehydrogenase n=1 Tax=Antrihabitans cavernicola TaxID=2495913 RepID=A0A5A7SC63_9NOCA|nr:PQQ-dependent sugar dehydrogenase [Spelaeibacter cavernicola]KAA0022183.1 PQQ-dependent sugar dehydrogenase [Spelaeibacter cavernicola]
MSVLLGACSDQSGESAPPPAGTPAPSLPAVDVTTVLDGLDHPWDVITAPDGTIITGERSGRVVARHPDGRVAEVSADRSDLFVGSETGLMGMALATDFAASRKVFTCQGFRDASTTDIRVQSWTADADWTSLTRTGTVISGFPVTSGRHGGCRILPQPDGTLFIGTGDSAQPSVPQNRNSLGGKVLHVDAATGRPAAGNPDPTSPIYTLGHRNVQGLAARPNTSQIFSIEQGSSRDDEVNLLRAGANYGWKPDRNPNKYDESVPMTDPDRVPGAVGAVWSSGPSTIATGGGTFVTGKAWGAWDGSLAVGALKGQRVVLLRLSEDGTTVVEQSTLPELSGTEGRIRTLATQADGSLLVTTDNGSSDKVLRVRPQPNK